MQTQSQVGPKEVLVHFDRVAEFRDQCLVNIRARARTWGSIMFLVFLSLVHLTHTKTFPY